MCTVARHSFCVATTVRPLLVFGMANMANTWKGTHCRVLQINVHALFLDIGKECLPRRVQKQQPHLGRHLSPVRHCDE